MLGDAAIISKLKLFSLQYCEKCETRNVNILFSYGDSQASSGANLTTPWDLM
jgi:hypothetical protein